MLTILSNILSGIWKAHRNLITTTHRNLITRIVTTSFLLIILETSSDILAKMSTSSFTTFRANPEQNHGSTKRKRQSPLSKNPVGGRPRKYATPEEAKAVDRMKSRERQRHKRARQKTLLIESSIGRSGLTDASESSAGDTFESSAAESSILDSDSDFSDAAERSLTCIATRYRGLPPRLNIDSAFSGARLLLPRNPIFLPDAFTAASRLRLPTNLSANDLQQLEVIQPAIGRLHYENWNEEEENDSHNQQYNNHNDSSMSLKSFCELLILKYMFISNCEH